MPVRSRRIRQTSPRVARAALLGALVGLTGPSLAAQAQLVVNIDLEAGDPGDVVHVGADGVLSGGGTVWNGVDSGTDAFDLVDENGVATAVDVVFTGVVGGPGTDSSSTNDLQDSGTFQAFEIRGLDPNATYDVAIYGGSFASLTFEDALGPLGSFCTGALTYSLPGVQNGDYCLYTGRSPADLGGGISGFGIGGLDGLATGVQIRRSPSVPSLSPLGLLAVAAAGVGVAMTLHARARRRGAA